MTTVVATLVISGRAASVVATVEMSLTFADEAILTRGVVLPAPCHDASRLGVPESDATSGKLDETPTPGHTT